MVSCYEYDEERLLIW